MHSSTVLKFALITGLAMTGAPAAQAADYVAIVKQVEVDRPADLVWQRVGDYCAIADWMKTDCGYLSGTGGVGTVRRILKGTVTEVMVAQTSRSYTYWQTQGNMAGAAYHGTLAAESVGPSRTRLTYTLFYDQAALASDADRRAQHERLDGRFQGFLAAMKEIAERR